MYTLLIVEDEKLELETLRDYIDWTALGINQVYTATNGLKALEIIERYEPDIMISDIYMPGINGIMLLESVREMGYKTKSIFLSGYDDFEYVRSALQLDAIDYLLKPFSNEAIKNAVEKVKLTLEKEKVLSVSVEVAQQKVLERICLEENSEDISLIQQLGELKNETVTTSKYKMWAMYGLDNYTMIKKIKQAYVEVLGVVNYQHITVFFILDIVDIIDHVYRVQELIKENYCLPIVYYEEKVLPIQIRAHFDKLLELDTKSFYLYDFKPMSVEQLELLEFESSTERIKNEREEIEELKQCILSGQKETTLTLVKKYMDKNYGIKRTRFIEATNELLEFINEEILTAEHNVYSSSDTIIKKEILDLERKSFYQHIYTVMLNYIESVVEVFNGYERKKQNYVVAELLNYIHNNYHQPISMEELAQRVNLSPNYIRTIFKEEQKVTVLEYLTDYRLQKASEFLNDPTLKVKEVSYQVGYENVSYFCSIFTKRYGKSPNEYRKYI